MCKVTPEPSTHTWGPLRVQPFYSCWGPRSENRQAQKYELPGPLPRGPPGLPTTCRPAETGEPGFAWCWPAPESGAPGLGVPSALWREPQRLPGTWRAPEKVRKVQATSYGHQDKHHTCLLHPSMKKVLCQGLYGMDACFTEVMI